MTNEERLLIQQEIIEFLANVYYHFNVDKEYINDIARVDSYKIMSIIEKHHDIEDFGAAVQKVNPCEHP